MRKYDTFVWITCEPTGQKGPYRVTVQRHTRSKRWRHYYGQGMDRVQKILDLIDAAAQAGEEHFMVSGFYPKAGR